MKDNNVINTVAQLNSGNSVPTSGVLLATVAVDSDNQITGVTDSRMPVTSKLPANLTAQRSAVNMQSSLFGTARVPANDLTESGKTVSQKVYYLDSQQKVFSSPPMVTATVQGTLPFAVSVVPDLDYFTLTLTALQTASTSMTAIDVHWIALALS